jgi:hypothetical protein
MKIISTRLCALVAAAFIGSFTLAADPARVLADTPQGTPAGVWQSDIQTLPTAGCHPHCGTDKSQGHGYGDPYSFAFSPREVAPAGYVFQYANPRIVSQSGNGCPFEDWGAFQSNAGGATMTAYARSEPCSFVVALDRFAVPIHN